MSNEKIQAAAAGRLFIIGPPAAEAAMKIGDAINLAAALGICSLVVAWH
jgi:hypothetical protein